MLPIEDYAIIGNCRSAALISSTGSLDWLCWPRFDSPAVFGALLDAGAGAFWIRPHASYRSERRYVPGTNVLETRFVTDGGACVVTDFMPVASRAEQRSALGAEHEIVRIVECERGEVALELGLEPRSDYGKDRPRPRDAGRLGVRFELRDGLLAVRSELPLRLGESGVSSRVVLRAGEVRSTSLSFAESWPAVISPLGAWCLGARDRSVAWWQSWSARLRYDGPRREAVLRSALTLKLLVHAPSGAVIAAPTTSLPERVGGDLNWDYRFCWLRDASLTVRALFGLGYNEEAEAFLSWLLHGTRLTQPRLCILYDVWGNDPAPERTLPHLSGYRASRPVRAGNAADGQLQLDVYGEVVDAAAQFAIHGGSFDRETRRLLVRFGEYVCKHWQEPDEGIWEPRSGKAHNTHSRVMCWSALTRLLELHRRGKLDGAPVDRFEQHRSRIATELRERAWNPQLGSYVSRLDGADVDASLLALSWTGFEPVASPRMQGTYRRLVERLGAGNGLMYRYRTDDSPGEGAFGICGFWAAEYLAMGGGGLDAASSAFDRLCSYANDVGLLAEEIDPQTGAALGNFPQAFSHVGLINTALTLTERLRAARQLASEATA